MRPPPIYVIDPDFPVCPEKLIDRNKPINLLKLIDPDPLFLFGHLNALPPSKEGVFDSSNPLNYRPNDNPNPWYFPFPWGEKRWKEWMETPESKSADPKKVTFLDLPGSLDFKNHKNRFGSLDSCLKLPPNPLTRNDDHLTPNVFHNEWREYVRNTVKKPKRSFRSALLQALETRPTAREEAVVEPASESQEEAPVKRVHWCDTDNVDHHVYLKPAAELGWRQRLNPLRYSQQVQKTRDELLVKPGPGYAKRAAAWMKTRVLRLPTRPPAASPFKSSLKTTSRPKQEQIDEPADTHTLIHTPPPDVPSTTLQHCDISRLMCRPTGNVKAIK